MTHVFRKPEETRKTQLGKAEAMWTLQREAQRPATPGKVARACTDALLLSCRTGERNWRSSVRTATGLNRERESHQERPGFRIFTAQKSLPRAWCSTDISAVRGGRTPGEQMGCRRHGTGAKLGARDSYAGMTPEHCTWSKPAYFQV